jgi:ABC-2 type transport system ATP-binding protein
MLEGNLALKVSNLGKTFRRQFHTHSLCALSNVSLEVPTGMVLGVMGPNCAGKSTLIHLCLGLLKPSSGSIQVFGLPLADIPRPSRISAILQTANIPAYLSPREVLFFLGSLAFVPEEILEARINHVLEKVKLQDRKNDPTGDFSRGMLQRLLIAQGMLADPDLLFLDEPSESLDMDGIQMLLDWIHERKVAGKTSVLASHDLKLVERSSDQIALLQKGLLSEPKTLCKWTNNGIIELGEAIRRYPDPSQAKSPQ